ncbi:hypothetical protein AHF37_10873 [Paragonimus kellicotti]|nr:hypothetical protein AHF37_10872 [Paragonimus kellicotti]KAF6770925.1 hypothetical protein AHF37_10873 [Paragonimus kellicotti]
MHTEHAAASNRLPCAEIEQTFEQSARSSKLFLLGENSDKSIPEIQHADMPKEMQLNVLKIAKDVLNNSQNEKFEELNVNNSVIVTVNKEDNLQSKSYGGDWQCLARKHVSKLTKTVGIKR